MRPFSAGYFLKENRGRCVLLMFMFFLTYIAYIGGIYITNLEATYEISIQQSEKYLLVYPEPKDEDFSEYERLIARMKEEERITVLPQGIYHTLYTKSIMGFEVDYRSVAFRSVEDFKTFCDYMEISCDFDKLKNGSFIASRMAANNRAMKLGDKLEEKETEVVHGTSYLDAITEEQGYTLYYINDGNNVSSIVLPTDMSLEAFEEYVDELAEEFDFWISNAELYRKSVESNTQSFYVIYMFIVILLALVMAVTINAAFVGMYQHREPEFAIYRAIGISKKRIIGKIIKELLLLDIIGIVLGGAVLLITIYLFNHLYLIPRGLMLFYYHPIALFGMLLCNVTVLVPLILTRGRRLLRADICDF